MMSGSEGLFTGQHCLWSLRTGRRANCYRYLDVGSNNLCLNEYFPVILLYSKGWQLLIYKRGSLKKSYIRFQKASSMEGYAIYNLKCSMTTSFEIWLGYILIKLQTVVCIKTQCCKDWPGAWGQSEEFWDKNLYLLHQLGLGS